MTGSTGSLRAYIITRTLLMVPMLLLLVTFTFFILRVAPGDPVTALYGEHGNPQLIDQVKRELGLYDPLYVQYFRYVHDIFTGNMGTSIVTRKPVIQEVSDHLPSLNFGFVRACFFARISSCEVIEGMSSDFVEAAPARGIPERNVFFRHALRNALVPVITTMGLTFALLFSGAILTETVFSFEGMGRFVYLAISYRDYPAIQGAVVYYGILMVVISLAIDIVNAFVDPRIRY